MEKDLRKTLIIRDLAHEIVNLRMDFEEEIRVSSLERLLNDLQGRIADLCNEKLSKNEIKKELKYILKHISLMRTKENKKIRGKS